MLQNMQQTLGQCVQSATEVLVMSWGKHSILHEGGGRHLCGTAEDKKTAETREMRQDSKKQGAGGRCNRQDRVGGWSSRPRQDPRA